MKVNEIILDVMQNTTTLDGKRITQAAMVTELNNRFQQRVTAAALSDRLKNQNMTTNTVVELLDVLGYELVIRPKKDSRKTYIVERGEKRVK